MIQQLLKRNPLFRELDDEELTQILMVGRVRRFSSGTSILTEGEPGGSLYLVTDGEVRVTKAVPGVGAEALSILAAGEIFGEVEFFDGSPAAAGVVAHRDCEVFLLPHDEIESLLRNRPLLAAKLFWAFGRTLASRLRESNRRMAALLAMSHGD
jgi:CRP/FNR family transcriptional regulator, cyclic AMP receptor protein